ncbi:putative homeobox and c2h2 transcription protein [Botrytis fragariae]|uniref:Putative homeobox and c2h2 transcription protein n=1 Tax=Botrytis fragariae TaxID=1964551 RepID=A0A8H6ALB2_9HELO|nr:putative homeobox and c2h2 transcription protein [Botrytis fragariae]KAF5869577.1 putative homeobox and c2h2 transcription protein [Botrytis fragariae]
MNMLPLMDNQENMLKSWASNNLGRPRDGSMAFLMSETGLQQEQIDHWWTCQENTRANILITSGEVGLPSEIDACGSESRNSKRAHLEFSDSTPILLGNNIQDFDADLMDFYPLENWCEQSSEDGLLPSDTMAFSDTDSIMSIPSGYGSKCASNRSSGRTWGTTSTLFSVDEALEAGPTNAPQSFQHHQITQPTKFPSVLDLQQKLADVLDTSEPITRHRSLESIPRPTTSLRRKSSTTFNSKKLPDIPQKFLRYSCTICGQPFERKGAKGDWKRHEQTKCEQQKLWYCMSKEPTVQILNIWHCILCNHFDGNRNGMINHLVDKHRFQNCWSKPLSERSHPRKDKLRDHLKKHHALSEGSTGWEAWHQDLPEKKAWGCGFCGGCFFTWDTRLDHIAEHYEKQGLDVSQWSLTNVIKGLLKQPREWDVLTAWNTVVGHNDESCTWSDNDALMLQRKLEYREGTPHSLAEEARRLAKISSHNSVPQTWPLNESRAARLTRNLLTGSSRKNPLNRYGGVFHGEPSVAHLKHADFGIQGDDYTDIFNGRVI